MVYFCRWFSIHVRTSAISTIAVSHFAALVMLLQVVATNFSHVHLHQHLKNAFHNRYAQKAQQQSHEIFSRAQHFAREGTYHLTFMQLPQNIKSILRCHIYAMRLFFKTEIFWFPFFLLQEYSYTRTCCFSRRKSFCIRFSWQECCFHTSLSVVEVI